MPSPPAARRRSRLTRMRAASAAPITSSNPVAVRHPRRLPEAWRCTSPPVIICVLSGTRSWSVPMGRLAIGGSVPERMTSFGRRPVVDQTNVDFPVSCGRRARGARGFRSRREVRGRTGRAAAEDAEAVASARSAHLTTSPHAAERPGVTVDYLRRLVAEQRLPYVRIGVLLRFGPVELRGVDRCGARGSVRVRRAMAPGVVVNQRPDRRRRPDSVTPSCLGAALSAPTYVAAAWRQSSTGRRGVPRCEIRA
jgi:hypothetical protein